MSGESGDNVIPFPTRTEPVGGRRLHTGSEQTGPVRPGSEQTGPVRPESEQTGPVQTGREQTAPVGRREDRFAQPGPDRQVAPGQRPIAPGRHPIAPDQLGTEPQPLWREVAGGIFRSERIAQGRTLGQVAERAGISPQYLSEVERGRKEPSSEMVESICGSLGLSLADLLSAGGRWLVVGGSRLSAPLAGSRSHPGTPTSPILMARLTG